MSSISSSSGLMSAVAPTPKTPTRVVAKKDAPVEAAPVVATPVKAKAAPAAAAAAAAAPAAPVKAKAAPKAKAVKAEVTPVVVSSTPVEVVTAVAAPTTTLDDDLKAVSANLNTLRETTSALLSQIKKLEKRVHREMKDARKRRRRVKLDENGVEIKRAPSIFERPTQVTAELLTFLGRPAGTLMSRSEVTKAVNEYVKAHNLKDKHAINPDAPLRALLSVGTEENLTYFNLQRYLNRHYIKAVVA
jgi:hypothetical protein